MPTEVLTRSFDNGQTGSNYAETIFTPASITQRGLKRFKSLIVTGDDPRLEAQPLFVATTGGENPGDPHGWMVSIDVDTFKITASWVSTPSSFARTLAKWWATLPCSSRRLSSRRKRLGRCVVRRFTESLFRSLTLLSRVVAEDGSLTLRQ
jgi:hypothetical protein